MYTAISRGEDPWTSCDALILAQSQKAFSHGIETALALFSGVSTHFLTECPGRDFRKFGASCVPNLYAREFFPTMMLHHQSSKNNTAWPMQVFDCLNAICDLVPREKCYTKLALWDFEGTGGPQDQIANYHLMPFGAVKIIKGQVRCFCRPAVYPVFIQT